LLTKIIQHYAAQAGVTARFSASKGTLVCPRIDQEGHAISIVVNLDGGGGQVELLGPAKDALTGEALASGKLSVGRYEYRAISG
jgi:beta-galactosidase